MLANTLNTNEVKDSAGVEVEFERKYWLGRTTEFAKIGESPAAPYRLKINHQESGQGLNKRRRSVVRFDKSHESDVDQSVQVTSTAYLVVDAPVGAVTTMDELKNVLANLLSFCATTGAGTTVLTNCTGSGAAALIEGNV